MAKAEPKRRAGRHLGVSAADPTHGKAPKSHRQHAGPGPQMQEDIVKSHAAQGGERQEARHQRQ